MAVSIESLVASSNFAIPKSRSFTVPSGVTRMLSGLTSRWMTSWRWAYDKALQTVRMSSRRAPTPRPLTLAERRDRHALDVLHHDERLALDGARRNPRAAVEQPADVRMLERGEDLPLAAEPLLAGGVAAAEPQHLDGDGLLELVVASNRLVDGSHPTSTDVTEKSVVTDGEAEPSVANALEPRCHGGAERDRRGRAVLSHVGLATTIVRSHDPESLARITRGPACQP